VLNGLEAADGPAELEARLGVVGRHLHHPHRATGLLTEQRNRGVVQCVLHCGATVLDRADQAGRGLVQAEPALFAGLVDGGQRADREALRVPVDGEHAGSGQNVEPLGRRRVEHERLRTGQSPGLAVLGCRGGRLGRRAC